MDKNSKIYIAGHRGVAGSALCRMLKEHGYTNVIARSHAELDLTNQSAVNDFFEQERPEYVFFFAAKRVSILEKKSHPLDACLASIQMTTNVLEAAHNVGVKRLLLASSASAYPRSGDSAIKEDAILSGPYEKSNEPYALSKILGAKLCEYYYRQCGDEFFSIMPTTFFGPGDNFEIGKGPVVPTLIHRFHDAKVNQDEKFVLWGTGKPKREIFYVGNVASACMFLMENAHGGANYNLGNDGNMISIMELAQTIAKIVGYSGEIVTDPSKPDGAKFAPLDSSLIHEMGWKPAFSFEEGLRETYQWFLKQEYANKEYKKHE